MARLLSWPAGVRYISLEPLSGPRTIGAGSSESISGFAQTVASPFGLWRWRFGFPLLKGEAFRRYRGVVAALHGGANALRVPIYDPDKPTNANALGAGNVNGVQWTGVAGDSSWFVPSTGVPWAHSTPTVPLVNALAVGDVNIVLPETYWGHTLNVGDYISFGPVYFGLHVITQVYSDGNYKIWPPVRKALTVNDWATLDPIVAMRLESEEAGSTARGQWYSEGTTLTLVEVEDADVRAYFADYV